MDISSHIPPLLIGDELNNALTVLPAYHPSIRNASKPERLLALNSIFDIYVPSPMSIEIYTKLYLAFVRSLQKKESRATILQGYENRKLIRGQPSQGIVGGADSFTIIGISGIGKSIAISRAISIITQDEILTIGNTKIIPFLTVQTPADSSIKGLLLVILQSIDAILKTRYYEDAVRARATLDMLVGSVSQVCLNHICVLVIDEAQHLVASKNGTNLVNTLVQLINNAGISLCFVGTPECKVFFESAFQLARRSLGLYYPALPFDDYFFSLCKTVFTYQYTKALSPISESIVEWLYLRSGGVTAVLVGLVQAAQELAILDDIEQINTSVLNEAYKHRFAMLHGFIDNDMPRSIAKTSQPPTTTLPTKIVNVSLSEEPILASLITSAKNANMDIITFLASHLTIEELEL